MESNPANQESGANPHPESAEYLELTDAIDLIKQRNQFIRDNDPLGWSTGHVLNAKFDGRPSNYEGDVYKVVTQEGAAPKKMFKVSELEALGKRVEDYIKMKISERPKS